MKKITIKFYKKEELLIEKELTELPKLKTIKAVAWWTKCEKIHVFIEEKTKSTEIKTSQIITINWEENMIK